jgi:hypothetical protein
MDNNKNDIDQVTRKLMKESLVKMPSSDFSDRIMQQILAGSADVKKSVNYLKKAWVLLGISVIILPLVFLFTSEIFRRYFTIIHDFLAEYFVIIQYTAAVAFICLVMFLLDMLLRQTFESRKSRFMLQ